MYKIIMNPTVHIVQYSLCMRLNTVRNLWPHAFFGTALGPKCYLSLRVKHMQSAMPVRPRCPSAFRMPCLSFYQSSNQIYRRLASLLTASYRSPVSRWLICRACHAPLATLSTSRSKRVVANA